MIYYCLAGHARKRTSPENISPLVDTVFSVSCPDLVLPWSSPGAPQAGSKDTVASCRSGRRVSIARCCEASAIALIAETRIINQIREIYTQLQNVLKLKNRKLTRIYELKDVVSWRTNFMMSTVLLILRHYISIKWSNTCLKIYFKKGFIHKFRRYWI